MAKTPRKCSNAIFFRTKSHPSRSYVYPEVFMSKRGERAYLMYMQTQGITWREVAAEMSMSEGGARVCAKGYATKHKKSWPPLEVGDVRRLDGRMYKGPLCIGDRLTIRRAEGVYQAPWYETLDPLDTL
jgi:hypothetical protein